MRRSILCSFGFLLAAAASLPAQDTVIVSVYLPRGEVHRACTQWHAEAIYILPADSRDPGPAADGYLAQLAHAIGRRLKRVSPDSAVLFASFAARIMKSGAVTDLRLLSSSGRGGFDMDARYAASLTAGDRYVTPAPPAMPDSFTVLISFGRHQDGSDRLVQHRWCPAIPLPWNPALQYPETSTIWRMRVAVHVDFTVDTMNTVDPYSIVLPDSTSEIFAAAARRHLGALGFLSAEFDGRRERQALSQELHFIPPDSVAAATP